MKKQKKKKKTKPLLKADGNSACDARLLGVVGNNSKPPFEVVVM